MHRKSREKHQDKTRNFKLPKLEIKNFSGKLAAWMTFIDSFEATVDRSANLSDVEKFNFLLSYLERTLYPSWHAIFREYSLSLPSALQCSRHPRNMLKQNSFWQTLNGKVVFVFKVYNLTIINPVIIKQCFQNIRRISPKYCKVMKIFL